MKLSTKLLTLALIAVPVVPAVAFATTAAPQPVVVARYTFNKGISSTGVVAEDSGRGVALKVRAAQGGKIRTLTAKSGNRYLALPPRCRSTTNCPRALLQGGDDSDLDPGTRRFRWGARVLIAKAQVLNSSNVMQKGIVSTESQWKMQVGATYGKAQCVVVGRGSTMAYIARSTVTVADSRWHSVVCLRNGTALAVYVDGRNRGQVRLPASLSISNSAPLRIAGPNLNTVSDFYNGLLDDVHASLG